MAREPEELTELWRALGAQLVTYRVAAELTQGQLAKTGNYHPSAVCHIEKGRAHGTERFWKLADERCGAQGALLDAFRTVQAAKHDHEARARKAQLEQARAKAATLRANVTEGAVPAGRVAGDECPGTAEDQAMRRREAIGLAARITVGASLSLADRAVLDTPPGASPVPARIGRSDVARIAAMTRALMAQDKAMGGGSCRDAVLGHLRWALQLRNATASDPVRAALNAELARLQNLAGWTSADLCLPLSAQRCYLRSLESARLAGEPLLAAHALGNLGDLYLQAEHFREALQIFQFGPIPAQDASSPGMLAGLALDEAWAYAGLGNVDEMHRALRHAGEHYDRAQQSPDEWVSTAVLPDDSDLPAGRANAYSQLASHHPRFAENAVIEMTEALTLRDPTRARALLWGRITLATNQYRYGETGLANTTTELVLASVSQISSRRTIRDLTDMGAAIRRHTTDSTALDLAHRIHTDTAA
ncbi:MAG: helix-turn-helix domain-containing protein [Pseudonocardiaceae bacterium]